MKRDARSSVNCPPLVYARLKPAKQEQKQEQEWKAAILRFANRPEPA